MAQETTSAVEATVREIRRKGPKKYSAEEKVRMVLEGLRGENKIADLCRREGLPSHCIKTLNLVFEYQGDSVRPCLMAITRIHLDRLPCQLCDQIMTEIQSAQGEIAWRHDLSLTTTRRAFSIEDPSCFLKAELKLYLHS